ncbi:MAG TPA: nitrilase-related carbon-nitrogen hydrolase [Ignavibacteriaceae bacterium]|jgi:predicted amidohydrolase|nr:nitrilase-related carbon-nitrogen hydrolase [Ignavibacteriaceae bacterium]
MYFSIVQYNPAWEDVESNKTKIIDLLNKYNPKPGVIVFPEMTLTGFTMKPDTFAETAEGSSIKFFAEIAKKYSSDVFAGVIFKEGNSFFNTLIHLSKDGVLKKIYRKIHPFSYGDENKHYEGGNETVITEIDGNKIGLSICYDLRFPELYRNYGKERVNLIINIANWPITRIHHWRALLRARAIENLCFVIGVNRVGNDPNLSYSGCSSIFDPTGEEMVCIVDEECISSTDLQLGFANNIREKFPFLNDIKLI